jgi:hypothetical protein
MNIIIALEQLGYVNQVDFVVDWIESQSEFGIVEWTNSGGIPTLAELQTAWDDWDAINGPTLTTFQEEAKLSVDNMAEATRLKYVTAGSTQAMTYQEKGDEAADYVAAGYPVDLSSYPFIQAEASATGNTATQAADNILAQKSAWIAIGAAVEEVRIGGKITIDAAVDEAAVEVARDIAITALELI